MSEIADELDSFVGKHVRIESADGHRFEGILQSVVSDGPGLVLRDARELPGEMQFATVFVPEVAWIVEMPE